LGKRDDVRMKIEMLEREPLARASHTALNFVDDEEDCVLACDRLQVLEELWRRHDIAALALNRFDDDGCDFTGVYRSPKNHIFQIVGIAVWNMRHTGNQRTESFALNGLRRRQ